MKSYQQKYVLCSFYQINILHAKQAEQESAAQASKKRINESVLRVQGMTDEIASLKNEIHERLQTISEKVPVYFFVLININKKYFLQQERISDLDLKNQELEKFQYVLNYKIDELTRLIQPREQEIERMKNQLLEVNQQLNLCELNEFINIKDSTYIVKFICLSQMNEN